jgi:hypothetical protein
MTLLPQALLALVGRHFVAFTLTTTGHMRFLSVRSSSVFVSCIELKIVALLSRFYLRGQVQLFS